jgi:hypothetical protein
VLFLFLWKTAKKIPDVIRLKSGFHLFQFGNADGEEGPPPPWVFTGIIDLEETPRKILGAQQLTGKILVSKNLRPSRPRLRGPVAPNA